MNNNPNDIDWNDPKVQKALSFFQQQQMQNQMQQQMMFQQQQMMLQQQQQYMMQQQLWNEFMQYCQMTGNNCNDQNLFNQYCQMKMSSMNNMNSMNNNFQQPQPQPQQQSMNPPTIFVNSPEQSNEQKPREDTVYLGNNQQPKETIPRMNKTIYADNVQGSGNNNINNFSMMKQFGMGGNNDVINVTLTATSGLKVVIPAPKTMSLCQLFKNYVQKVGVPESVIGTKIVFLFNAEKLDFNSQEAISKFFKNFQANITVLDQANIIGA